MKLLLALLLLFLSAVAAASPCPPTAVLSGDQAEINATADLLNARGIQTTPTPSCPATKVRMIRIEKQLLLEIEDPLGRTSRRLVTTHKAAATVIESWVIDALEPVSFDDLLPKEPAPTSAPVIEPTPTLPAPKIEPPLPVFELPGLPALSFSSRDLSVSLFSEVTVMKGGSLWLGSALSATHTMRRLQLTLLGRFFVRADRASEATSAAKSVNASDCTPTDTDGDGLTDLLDCPGDCIFIDIDSDGSFDDKQCQSSATSCSTLDINNDGTVDDFQCQGAPLCESGFCFGDVPFSSFQSGYNLQLELGRPFFLGDTQLTPGFAIGSGRLFAPELLANERLGHTELSLQASRNINQQLRLEARISAAVVPNTSESDGSVNARLSIGLHWDNAQ